MTNRLTRPLPYEIWTREGSTRRVRFTMSRAQAEVEYERLMREAGDAELFLGNLKLRGGRESNRLLVPRPLAQMNRPASTALSLALCPASAAGCGSSNAKKSASKPVPRPPGVVVSREPFDVLAK